jgi:glycine hydroxymethyltransferase
MVPFDDKSPFVTSGMRLGTPAITTRGAVEEDMEMVAQLIDKVITNHENTSVISEVKKSVNEMMTSRPLFKA